MDQHSLGFKLMEPACKEIMLPMQYCRNLLEFSVFSNSDDEAVMIRPLTPSQLPISPRSNPLFSE